MSQKIHAIFDAGAFRPLQPVDWPDGTRAEITAVSEAAPPTADAAAPFAIWPADYFEQTAGALAGENFERPPQGKLPQRNDW